MPGIEIRNLTRTTDIDDIYNAIVPLSINNETVGAVFGTALGSVTNCLNAALFYGGSLSGSVATLSTIQQTNNATISNLVTQALTSDSQITQLGTCVDARAEIGCVSCLDNCVILFDNCINTLETCTGNLQNSINSSNDAINLRATITTTDALDQKIDASNVEIDNAQNDISTINTDLLTKAGNTAVTAVNISLNTIQQSLRTSAVNVCSIKNDLTNLTTCVNDEAGLIDAAQSDILTLDLKTTAGTNSAISNKSAITLLNTCMSDLSTLSSNKIASIATDITTINSNIDTVESDLTSEITRRNAVSTCLATVTAGLLTSAVRVDTIEVQGNTNASSIGTINTELVVSASNIRNVAEDVLTLDSTLTTTTSVVQNLSSFRDVIVSITDGKASNTCAGTLNSGITALNNSITLNHNTGVSLSADFYSLSAGILIPALTSINSTLITKAAAICTDSLQTQIGTNDLQISQLETCAVSLNSSITSVRVTTISAITAQLPSTPGSFAYNTLTAKADLNTYNALSSDLNTCMGRLQYIDSTTRAVSSLVIGVSSTTGSLSSEVAARASCSDLESLNACLLDNYATTTKVDDFCSSVETSIQTVCTSLQDQINTVTGDSTVVVGDLGTRISSISSCFDTVTNTLNQTVTSLSSEQVGFSGQFLALSAFTNANTTLANNAGVQAACGRAEAGANKTSIDSISSEHVSLSGNFTGLSGQFNSLSGLTNTLNFSATNLEQIVVVRLNTKASTTCTDGIAVDISQANTNINQAKSSVTFLSSFVTTISSNVQHVLSTAVGNALTAVTTKADTTEFNFLSSSVGELSSTTDTLQTSTFNHFQRLSATIDADISNMALTAAAGIDLRSKITDVRTLTSVLALSTAQTVISLSATQAGRDAFVNTSLGTKASNADLTTLETSAFKQINSLSGTVASNESQLTNSINDRALITTLNALETSTFQMIQSLSATSLFGILSSSQAITERALASDVTTLETTVNRQGISATNICTSIDSLNTTIAGVTGGTLGVNVSSIQNLQNKVDLVNASLESQETQITTINNNVLHGACAVFSISALFNPLITANTGCVSDLCSKADTTGAQAVHVACGVGLLSALNASCINCVDSCITDLCDSKVSTDGKIVHQACAVALLSGDFNPRITAATNCATAHTSDIAGLNQGLSDACALANTNCANLKAQLDDFGFNLSCVYDDVVGTAERPGIGCIANDALNKVNNEASLLRALTADCIVPLIDNENQRIDNLCQIICPTRDISIPQSICNLNSSVQQQNTCIGLINDCLVTKANQCSVDELTTSIGTERARITSLCSTSVSQAAKIVNAENRADEAICCAGDGSAALARVNVVEAHHGVSVNANGSVTGYQLNACSVNGNACKSSFKIQADCFIIGGQNPSDDTIQPFTVENNCVRIDGACIRDLTVDTLQIANNAVSKVSFIQCLSNKQYGGRVNVHGKTTLRSASDNSFSSSFTICTNTPETIRLTEANVVTVLGRPFTTDINVSRCSKPISKHLGALGLGGTFRSYGANSCCVYNYVTVGKIWQLTRLADNVNGGECIVYESDTSGLDDTNFRIIDCIPIDSKSYCGKDGTPGQEGKVVTVDYCWSIKPILFDHGIFGGQCRCTVCGLGYYRARNYTNTAIGMCCTNYGPSGLPEGRGPHTVCDANGTSIGTIIPYEDFDNPRVFTGGGCNYFKCLTYCICPIDVIFDSQNIVK